jgi:S-formylglutathione hydrolase FrmB
MRRSNTYASGVVHRFTIHSDVLKNNPLGDPCIRELCVYTPHGYHGGQAPLLLDLPGFNTSALDHVARKSIGENVPERLDRLVSDGLMVPSVVVFADCMTALGGNQYINSGGTGQYADYLIEEVVPFVEATFGCGGPGRRGVFGKSSGGFGALWHAMHYPHFWSAASCNSGDMDFDIVYKPGIYAALRELERFDYSAERFLNYFATANKVTPQERSCRMHLALAATYDPDPGAYTNIRLPCDLRTAQFDAERWENWLRHDPLRTVEMHADALRSLKALWIDCGTRDQYFLHFGARHLSRELTRLGIQHVHEEFDDEHLDVDYRMDRFLPYLAGALAHHDR